MMGVVDLVDLELVVAVADAGSITHGAERAHLSLPSASARIRALERAIGVSLFDRDRRGVSPTAAGMLLVRHARGIRQAVERMHIEIAEHADGDGATVRVMANTAATTSALVPALGAFLAANPKVRIDIEESPSHHIVTAVADRRAELGIVADSVDLGGLTTRTLRADPLVVVTTPHDPLTSRASVSYADIIDRPFVGLSHAATFPLGSRPTFRARMPTVDAVCHAVIAGAGIAILPRHSVDRWVAGEGIATIDLDDQWARRRLVLCFIAENELSSAARALHDHLVAADPVVPKSCP
jgi:DNA-binding transcriptional LysR family regulator